MMTTIESTAFKAYLAKLPSITTAELIFTWLDPAGRIALRVIFDDGQPHSDIQLLVSHAMDAIKAELNDRLPPKTKKANQTPMSDTTTNQIKSIRPLYDRILVKRFEAESVTAGGLHIPDMGREKPTWATVVAVGNGKLIKGEIVPLDVKPGDRVLFSKYSGTEVKIDGVDHMIMREDDILGIGE